MNSRFSAKQLLQIGITLVLPLATVGWMCGILIQAHRLPSGDAAHFIATEVRLAELLRAGEIGRFLQLTWTLLAPHPPLGYLPGILAQLLTGDALRGAVLTQGALLLLAWDALRRFEPSRWPIAAWAVLFASPITWLGVEQHGRDLVAAGAILQTLSHLHASDGLRIRRHAIGFGLWMGAGFLVKYTFPMFLLLPCALSIGALGSAERRRHLAVAIGAFLLVAGPWYLAFFSGVRSYLTDSATVHESQGNLRLDVWAPEALAFYPLAIKDAIGWPGVGLLILGLGGWIYRAWGPERARLPWGPTAAAMSGIAVLSTIPQAQDRYATPAVLCLSTLALGFRGWFALIPLALGAVQAWSSARAFAPGARSTETQYLHPLATAGELSWPRSAWYRPTPVSLDGYHLDEAFAVLAQGQGETGTVGLLLGDAPYLPPFGAIVMAAQSGGHLWDYGVVKIQAGGPGDAGPGWALFRGPVFDGAWPPGEFDRMLSVLCAGDEAAVAWRASRLAEPLFEATASGGCVVRVDRVVLGPLPALDGPLANERAHGGGPSGGGPPGGGPSGPPNPTPP